jgi:hypothetical protein
MDADAAPTRERSKRDLIEEYNMVWQFDDRQFELANLWAFGISSKEWNPHLT